MSRRRDPIAVLRRVLRIREDEAGAEVAAAQQRLDDARARLAARRDDPTRQRIEAASALRLDAMRISGIRDLELLELARVEVRTAETEVAEALDRWSQMSARRKSAERLEDRRNAEAAIAAARSSQQSLDELALLLRSRDLTRADDREAGR